MKLPRRRLFLPVLAAAGAVVAGSGGGPARAAIAPAFATKVALDAAWVTGASLATDVAFAADGRAVITTKAGPIYVRHANGTLAAVTYPFPGTLDANSEKGILGVVADPNVAQNRAFYFYVSDGPDGDKHRVYRAVLGAATDTLTTDAVPIVAASRGLGPGLEGPANHDGGGLSISGGKLYVSVGDTGFNAVPPTNKYGSCLNKGNGKVLRLNLDGTIPGDNPLVGVASVTGCDSQGGPWTTAVPDRRVFVWGQRNPFRHWVDPTTSLVWVGDVGESDSEEIAVYAGNQNGGYPFVEGGKTWGPVTGQTCTTLTPSRACTPPVYSYDHSVGASVTGGRIVDGCGWNKVFGGASYVFADWAAGWIRVLPVNAARTGVTSTTPVAFADGAGPVSFRMGPDQSLYVVMNNDGTIQRLTPIDRTGGDCAAPIPSGSPASTGVLAGLLALAGLAAMAARTARRRRA
jgi:glucose/arabinose dehydrogenase